MMEVESLVILLKTEKKNSIVRKYLKQIVQILTTVKFVTRFDLVHINKVLEKAGFIGSKEDLDESKDSNIEKVLRWIGVRIGATGYQVSKNLKISQLKSYIKEITIKAFEDTIEVIRASLYQEKYKELLEDRIKALENDNNDELNNTIVEKTKRPKMSTIMRNAFMAR